MTKSFRDALLGKHVDALVEEGQAVRVEIDLLFGEGPAYLPEEDAWIFSDIPNNRILRFSEQNGVSVYRGPSSFANGNYAVSGGGFLTCEHLSRSVTRTYRDGTTSTVCSEFEGKRLNSPNDVVVGPDGSIWFTDPTYGIISDVEGKVAESEQAGNRVYRVGADGKVTAEIDVLQMPNGLAFSPDGTQLYVTDSGADKGPVLGFDENGPRDVYAFEMNVDNRVNGKGRRLYRVESGVPDGVRVDPDGYLWVATGAGVVCLFPSGIFLGKLATPGVASNLSFGGRDGDRLMITTEKSSYLIFR